jgi:hypothetical protein
MNDDSFYPSDSCGVPSEKSVALRVLSLGAVVMRAELETSLKENSDEDDADSLKQSIDRISNWIEEEGLSNYLTPAELMLIAQPAGSWDEDETVEVSWRLESLGVLLWVLKLIDKLPPWDEPFALEDLMPKLHLGASIKKFLYSVKLRSMEEMMAFREVGDLWHWRVQSTLLAQDESEDRCGCALPDNIHDFVQKALERKLIDTVKSGDMTAFDKPIHKLDEDEFMLLASIVIKRHYAIQWATGACGEWMSPEIP